VSDCVSSCPPFPLGGGGGGGCACRLVSAHGRTFWQHVKGEFAVVSFGIR
jgi:hypothetical protein